MRAIVMSGAVALALAASVPAGTGPSFAIYEGPWCMHESMGRGGTISRCDMRSFEMCRAESGSRGGTYCTQNPYYYANARQVVVHRPARHRRVR